MRSEMRELPGELTALDWGAAGLLHLLSIDVVEHQISEWIIALGRCKVCGGGGSREDAFVFNLAAGLNEARALVIPQNGLKETKPILCDLSDLKDDRRRVKIIDAIVAELKSGDASHRTLFNSYYYVAFDKYGEEGEYYFVPLSIPLLGTGASEETEQQFRAYLRKGDVPFRVDPERADQYRTTLLPAHGGVTPQLCRLALRSKDKRSKEETDPEPIDWFLADLAIIGKTEDHVHRKRSAIIAPIIHRRRGDLRCEGAVVLTCSVPGGFSPPKEDEQQGAPSVLQREFSRIIDIWATAPLSDLHRNLKRERKGPRARVIWEALSRVGLSPGPLEDQLRLELVERGAKGVVAIGGRVDSPARDVYFAVINAEALGHSVRTVMCPGPMLVPRVLCEPFGDEPVVDPEKARRHFDLMDRFTNPTSSENEVSAAARSIFRECLPGFPAPYVPLGEPTDGAHSVPNGFQFVRAGSAELRLLALVQGEGETCAVRSLLEELHTYCLKVVRSERPLPDEISPFFSLLQQRWTEQHDLGLNVGTEDSALKEAYRQFEKVINHRSVHSAFVFLGTKQFVPDLVADESALGAKARLDNFRNKYFAYPSYWLFENICNLMLEREVSIDRFEGTLRRNARFISTGDQDFPKVVVRYSTDDDLNDRWVSALTYFGIPVTSWLPRHAEYPEDGDPQIIDIGTAQDAGAPMAEYRMFLRRLLRRGCRVPALKRVLAPTLSDALEVTSIDVVIGSDGGHRLVTFDLKLGDQSFPTWTWRPMCTAHLVLFGLNTDHALEWLAAEARTKSSRFTLWNIAQGQRPLDDMADLKGALARLQEDLKRARESALASDQTTKRHQNADIPSVIDQLSQEIEELVLQFGKPQHDQDGLVGSFLSSLRGPRWLEEDVADSLKRLSTLSKMRAQVFRLSTLRSSSSDEMRASDDLFGGNDRSATDALRESLLPAIYKGVIEACDALMQDGLMMDNDYMAWMNLIHSQLGGKMDCAQLNGLYLPRMVRLEIPQRRRVTLVLNTLLSNVVKHHLSSIVEDSVPQGTVSISSLTPSTVAAAANDLSIVCNRHSLLVQNYAGHSKARPDGRKGTYRDLVSYLVEEDPPLGNLTNWKHDERADHNIFITELTLTEYFWSDPNARSIV